MASDLHIHTTFSDGQMTPEQIVEAAQAASLSYVAITDHDTIEGVRHLHETERDKPSGLTIIPGIEFSTEYEERDVHVLGYGIDIYSQTLHDKLAEISEARWTRFTMMIGKLNELGYDISEAEVLQVAGASESVSRSHIARVLVKKGLFPNLRAVFDEVLEIGRPAYIQRMHISAPEAVQIIRDIGGLPVLAHPLLIGDDSVVSHLMQYDFAGMEVFYPQHDGADVERYSRLADMYGLFKTGGSDFHALPGRYPETLGEFTVDDEYAEYLYSRLNV